MRVLQNHRDVAPQLAARDLLNRHAVHGDFSLFDLIKAGKQVGDRRLARAGGAHERDALAGLGIQGDVMEHRHARHIAKAHVLKDHMALNLLQRRNAFLQRLLGLIQHIKHALRARKGGKHRVHLHGNQIDRAVELARIVERHRQSADVKSLPDDHDRADARGQRIDQVAQLVRDRAHDARAELRADLRVAVARVELGELAHGNLLVGKHLDDLLSGNRLLCIAVEHAQILLLLLVGSAAASDDLPAGKRQNRGHDDRDGRQQRAGIDHQDDGAGQRDSAGNDLHERRVEHFAHGVHVVGEAGHDVACGVCVKIAHGQAHQLVHEFLAHSFERPLGHAEHDPLAQIQRDYRHGIHRRHHEQAAQQRRHARRQVCFRRIIVKEAVHDRAQKVGRSQRGYRAQHRAEHRDDQQRLFLLQIGKQTRDRLFHVLGLAARAQRAAAPGASAHIEHLLLRSGGSGCAAVARFKARFLLLIHSHPPLHFQRFPRAGTGRFPHTSGRTKAAHDACRSPQRAPLP